MMLGVITTETLNSGLKIMANSPFSHKTGQPLGSVKVSNTILGMTGSISSQSTCQPLCSSEERSYVLARTPVPAGIKRTVVVVMH